MENQKNWQKPMLEGSPVRPPVTDRVLISDEFEDGVLDSWCRIANSLERLEQLAKAFVPPEAKPKYMSTAEVAEAIDRSEQYVMKICRQGKITAAKVGGKWLIPCEAVDAMVRTNQWRKG